MNPNGSWEDDPDAPPSEEELRAAETLRVALDRGAGGPKQAELARAVRAAAEPAELGDGAHQRILARALPAKPASNVVRIAFGGGFAAVLAAAAAFAVMVGTAGQKEQAPAAALLAPRSAQDLFDDPFPREGGGSARVDRIASARSRDLRENRFARWGVR